MSRSIDRRLFQHSLLAAVSPESRYVSQAADDEILSAYIHLPRACGVVYARKIY
jgi:hypothetical protein